MKNSRSFPVKALGLALLLMTWMLSSCQKSSAKPEIDMPESALRMQEVSVVCNNISSDEEAVIIFGDGTAPVTVKGPFTVKHKFSEASTTLSGGVYDVQITVGAETVRKPIVIHPLLALSQLAEDMSESGYNKILLMAHRANLSDARIPENSIAAVEACIKAGVEFIETDTHITSDGHVVISHDQTVDRCTDGNGDITKMTLEQVRSFKLKDRNGSLTDMNIPTLKEFLAAAKGKIYVNLDYSPRTASTYDVMKVVRELDMTEQVLFYCNVAAKVEEVLSRDSKAHAYAFHPHYASLPGPGYFIQANYYPGKTPTDLSAQIKAGCLVTVNMLSGGTVDELLSVYPEVRVIQSDISDQLDSTLEAKGLR